MRAVDVDELYDMETPYIYEENKYILEKPIEYIPCFSLGQIERHIKNRLQGYDIKELLLAAELLRRNEITPEILKHSAESFSIGYNMAWRDAKRTLEESVKGFFNNEKIEVNKNE